MIGVVVVAGLALLGVALAGPLVARDRHREDRLLGPLRGRRTPIAELCEGQTVTVKGKLLRGDSIARGQQPGGPWLLRLRKDASPQQRARFEIADGTGPLMVRLGPGLFECFYRHPQVTTWEERWDSAPELREGDALLVHGLVTVEADPDQRAAGLREPALRLVLAATHVWHRPSWFTWPASTQNPNEWDQY